MKIAILSPVPANLKHIRNCLGGQEAGLEVQGFDGGLEVASSLLAREEPDLLVADAGPGGTPNLAALEAAIQRHGGIGLILIAAQPTPELLLQAMRIGVREVLPSPVSAEALQQALARIRARVGVGGGAAPAARSKGKILALVSCKGGSGATFLATNLAYALAQGKASRVALIDLNLHFGEALLYIHDGAPTTTVADVVSQIQRLDGDFLESSMVQVLPNFGLLAAPQNSERVADVKPEGIDRLLKVAAAHYDYVVLDVSRNLNAVTIEALDHADSILPVLQLTLPYIRDAKWLISVCRSLGYADSKLRLIVNRYEKGGDISLQDVERTLGVSIFGTVPNSYLAVAAAINHGYPILKQSPRDAVSKALEELAQELGVARKPGGGWFKGLLGKPRAQGMPRNLSVNQA